MMPLPFADTDRDYTILKITGKDAVKAHLHHLGLVENETIQLIQSVNGNVIVEVKGIRLAIDSTLARRILV